MGTFPPESLCKEEQCPDRSRYFKIMLKELAVSRTDYTCKEQNKELEAQSKAIVENKGICSQVRKGINRTSPGVLDY
jgi:hypothetical protein